MSTTIMDGTGDSHRAEVTSGNRLKTTGVFKPAIGQKSEDGDSYVISSGILNVSPTTTSPVLYFKNTSESNSFIINRVNVNWGDPDTVIQAVYYYGSSEPTANNTAKVATSPNFGTTGTPPFDVYAWDTNGSGMTTATLGTGAGVIFGAGGHTSSNTESAFIIPPGGTVSCALVTPPATANFFTALQGYLSPGGEF